MYQDFHKSCDCPFCVESRQSRAREFLAILKAQQVVREPLLKFVGQVVKVVGPRPEALRDLSWQNGYYKVSEVTQNGLLRVTMLCRFNGSFKTFDKKDYPPALRSIDMTGLFSLDPKKFIIEIVTPEEIVKKMMTLARDREDCERKLEAQRANDDPDYGRCTISSYCTHEKNGRCLTKMRCFYKR